MPPQALYLMNNPFVHEHADDLAVRVGMAYSEPLVRLSYAYRLLFGREAPSRLRLEEE